MRSFKELALDQLDVAIEMHKSSPIQGVQYVTGSRHATIKSILMSCRFMLNKQYYKVEKESTMEKTLEISRKAFSCGQQNF